MPLNNEDRERWLKMGPELATQFSIERATGITKNPKMHTGPRILSILGYIIILCMFPFDVPRIIRKRDWGAIRCALQYGYVEQGRKDKGE